MNRLPDDICRCHDDDCPANGTCARYLERGATAPRAVHATTLRTPEEPRTVRCNAYTGRKP